MTSLALAIVVLTGFYFVALAAVALLRPAEADRFLLGFAGSARKHYAELLVRFVVGGAFVLAAPRLPFPGVFAAFGWVLVGTTAGLLLIPWRWHQRFALQSVPRALRFLPWIGLASLALGGFLLWAVVRGGAG